MVQNPYTAVDTPAMGRVVFNDNLLSFSLSPLLVLQTILVGRPARRSSRESAAAGSASGGGAERPNVNLTMQQRILSQLDDDPPDLNPLSEHSRPSRVREAAPVAGAPKTHACGA